MRAELIRVFKRQGFYKSEALRYSLERFETCSICKDVAHFPTCVVFGFPSKRYPGAWRKLSWSAICLACEDGEL